jgi:hypothetical protein
LTIRAAFFWRMVIVGQGELHGVSAKVIEI